MRPRHRRREKPRIRITPPVVLLAAAAAGTIMATVLLLCGLAVGDQVEKPWVMAVCGPFLAGWFAAAGYRLAVLPDVATALPDGATESAAVVVRNRFGVVFWLLAALAAAMLVVTAVLIVMFALGTVGARTDPGASGLAATAMGLLVIAFCLAMVLWTGLIPARIFRWRKRIHMYLSAEGIGWTPPTPEQSSFLGWHRVRHVWYSSESIRGVVYTHRWRISHTEGLAAVTIEYPAGATPRPRYIRRKIRELASWVELT